ncbi:MULTISPECIES: hypothetical protein [unclassified Gilliamella]|uniref:hypothetical protein n=1 Tax=unclassified Gilliamella TaxID=2685620 RepID=UPI00080DD358|nr:hypothetical protein [Gilliamella apicola]OCG34201.1 hypothetical protein A9G32_09815 [Gilliamella apicola]OCG52417.1 hypothetical protein A9G27_10230 [Gilliamella apicola]OCG52554.1 hypothetical protein A9G26_02360 [Gilliamella apicola]
MQYHFILGTRHWQTYVLNLSNNPIRQVFTRNLFIPSKLFLELFSKLSTKLFSKIPLALAPLLLLPYSLESQALSATTSERIHGTAPYLTFDGGVTKVTEIRELLGIKLSDGRTFTSQNNSSSPTAPIKLPNIGDTLADIEMIVPPSSDSININDLVTQGKWGDDDGDGQGVGGVTASGSISVAFTDKNGNTVNRSDALSICSAPYKVTLTSTGGTLSTQYGVPRSSSFSGATVDYYINPYDYAGICSVRPNLLYGGTTGIDSYDSPRFAGPANIWNPDKGFLTQSTSPSSYELNFPTTGADGLYFDLLIGGVDGSQLTWSPVTHGGITATVTSVVANDSWIPGVDRGKVVARVTLSGPRADSTQLNSSNPSPLTSPSLPQDFELVGSDGRGNEVRYGFVLRQWFVNRGLQTASASNQTAWCNSLGYRMPRVRDLTNAVCSGWNSGRYCRGTVGATPSSGNNVFRRHIGAGFFTEWGYMSHYADVGFASFNYWTSDVVGGNGVYVYTYDGSVFTDNVSESGYAVCTAP